MQAEFAGLAAPNKSRDDYSILSIWVSEPEDQEPDVDLLPEHSKLSFDKAISLARRISRKGHRAFEVSNDPRFRGIERRRHHPPKVERLERPRDTSSVPPPRGSLARRIADSVKHIRTLMD